jgi:hypothetical protein
VNSNEKGRPEERPVTDSLTRRAQDTTAGANRAKPRVEILLALEESPRVDVVADTREDAARIYDWLSQSEAAVVLVGLAQSLEHEASRKRHEFEDLFGCHMLPWGRHRGRTVEEVAEQDPAYLRWLASEAVLDDRIRETARALLIERTA